MIGVNVSADSVCSLSPHKAIRVLTIAKELLNEQPYFLSSLCVQISPRLRIGWPDPEGRGEEYGVRNFDLGRLEQWYREFVYS